MLPVAAAGLTTTGYPMRPTAARVWSRVPARILAAEGTLKTLKAT